MVLIVPIEGLIALAWTLTSAALCLTFGRFYIRWRKMGRLQLDDGFNGLAIISLICFTATSQPYLRVQYNFELYELGLGRFDATNDQQLHAENLNTANVVFFWTTIYLVRATFLALYWALFRVSNKFRIPWLCVVAYTLISYLATFLAIFWGCGTPSKIANVYACNSISQEIVVSLTVMWCVLNTFGDVLIILLPIGVLRKVQIIKGQKLGLVAILSLVLIDILFDILHTIYTCGSYAADFPNGNSVWTPCEPTIAVTICAMPTYRVLYTKTKPASSSTYQNLWGTAQKSEPRRSPTLSMPYQMDDLSMRTQSSPCNGNNFEPSFLHDV